MRDEPLDLDTLLHPARAYARPKDVVSDTDLTLYEKRAILASWASDACAVAAAPALRQHPLHAEPVQFDEVMDALRELDRLVDPVAGLPPEDGSPGKSTSSGRRLFGRASQGRAL